MDKFDINSLGIVLALVGAVLAALLGGIGSAIGEASPVDCRRRQFSSWQTDCCMINGLLLRRERLA